MKYLSKICILIFVWALTLSSCKKYPEGGFLRQGPKTFITDKVGYWQLALYEVNGIDSTFLLPEATIVEGYHANFLTFSKYSKREKKGFYYSRASIFQYDAFFLEHNAKISFIPRTESPNYCIPYKNYPSLCFRDLLCPESSNATIWNITKIRDKECILQLQLSNSYKIILKR